MTSSARTQYNLPDGKLVKVGDRIRVVTEGTVTEIGDHWIDYQNKGSEAACVYPNDGEFVSLEVLPPARPEVKPGQVWDSRGIQFFVTTMSDGETPNFMHSGTGYDGCSVRDFFNVYPDARLVYDPEA